MWKPTILFTALSTFIASPSQAATVFVNFDSVTTGASINEHYNGGTDSSGVMGSNLHLSFLNFLTTTGFGETSGPNLAYNIEAVAIINFAPGFGRVQATYGAFTAGRFDAYTAVNGAGSLLGSYVLTTNNPFAFERFVFQFSGTARSLVLNAGATQIGIDDLLLTQAVPSGVPEPIQWSYLITGMFCVGSSVRHRRAKLVLA